MPGPGVHRGRGTDVAPAFLERFGHRFDWSALAGPGTFDLADTATAPRRMRDAAETKAVVVS
ncbi:hypothetical protein [Streptosporangium sp. NPDC001681]|uniref:hypothetical protein n=1 Tax=Streptosporangium sp. NPDC001681 TaxID=3154395 RepID=UPI003325B30A